MVSNRISLRRRTFVFFLQATLSIFVFLVVFRASYAALDAKNKEQGIHHKKKSIHYYFVAPDEEFISFGFASLNLEEEESNSIKGIFDEGKLTQVSNSDSTEFECYGSCFCNGERRSGFASHTTHNRFFILITALSTFFAETLARKYLKEECEEHFQEECSPGYVMSEVDECDVISEDVLKSIMSEIDEEESYWKKTRRITRRFYCQGKCVTKIFKRKATQEVANSFGCEKLDYSGEIEIEIDNTDIGKDYGRVRARRMFMKELTPYCKNASKTTYWYEEPNRNRQRIRISACSGRHMDGNNPTISCRQTYPVVKRVIQEIPEIL